MKARIPIPDPRSGLAPSRRKLRPELPSQDPKLLVAGGSLLPSMPRPLKPPGARSRFGSTAEFAAAAEADGFVPHGVPRVRTVTP